MSAPSVPVETTRGRDAARRLTRDDWLRAGLDTIARHGVGGVRIGRLAAELGVTSGSFYWHFKSRDCFLDAVLRYWFDEVVGASLAQIARECPSGKARLLAFVNEEEDSQLPDYDQSVWCWALSDTRAARSLERAARRRIARLQDWFAQEGVTSDEAELRSELLYRGWLTQRLLGRSRARRSHRAHRYVDILLR